MAFERELNEPDDISDADIQDASCDAKSSPRVKIEPESPSSSVLRGRAAGPSVASSSRMTAELYREMMDISTSASIDMITDDEDETERRANIFNSSASGYPSSPFRNVWKEAGA